MGRPMRLSPRGRVRVTTRHGRDIVFASYGNDSEKGYVFTCGRRGLPGTDRRWAAHIRKEVSKKPFGNGYCLMYVSNIGLIGNAD